MRVAIVGAGLMGRWHAHFARAAGANVVAIVDPDGKALSRLARRLRGAKACESLAEALALDLAALHVCTPTGTHHDVALQGIDAGLHLLVEKPIAPTLRETRDLLAMARARKVVLTPVHQCPFQRGMRDVVVNRRRLGDLVRVDATICSAGGEGRSGSERSDILREMLAHPLSVLRAVRGGEGAAPGAWTLSRFTGDDLDMEQLAGSTSLSIRLSLRGRPTRHEVSVMGTRASAHADLFHGFAFFEDGRVSRVDKALAPLRRGGRTLTRASTNLVARALKDEPAYPGLKEIIQCFYSACAGASPPPVTEDEVLEVADLMERLGTAARR